MKTIKVNNTECVLISSVPEAKEFEKWLFGSAAPMPNNEDGWAYMGDYIRFKRETGEGKTHYYGDGCRSDHGTIEDPLTYK